MRIDVQNADPALTLTYVNGLLWEKVWVEEVEEVEEEERVE